MRKSYFVRVFSGFEKQAVSEPENLNVIAGSYREGFS